MCMSVSVPVLCNACAGQTTCWIFLELELQMLVMWELGIQPGSFAKATIALNC